MDKTRRDRLLADVDHDDSYVARQALIALASLVASGDAEAKAAALRAANHDDSYVARQALAVLAPLVASGDVEAKAAALRAADHDDSYVARQALIALTPLVASGDAEVKAAVLRAVDCGGSYVAGQALVALAPLVASGDAEAKTVVKAAGVPVVVGLDRKILAAVEAGGELKMDTWHECATTHCRAGWAITLAGEAGRLLEERYGPAVAGSLIYAASTGQVPDFYASDEEALADVQACAARQQ